MAGQEYQSKVNEEINKSLLATSSARGVLTFCEWSAGEFDVTNAVTALHRMARAPDRRYYSKDPRWPSVIGKAHQMIVQSCTDENAFPRLSKEYLLNAAWSFAALDHRDDYLMEVLCDEVLQKTKELGPQDMSNLTRALANLSIQNEKVMDRVLLESKARIGQFRPPQLASLSWGLATLQLVDTEMMEKIGKECTSKMRLFQPKPLSELAWAFSTLGIKKASLNGAMTDAVIGRIEEFQVKEIAKITESFAKLTAGTESVMEVLADRLTLLVSDLDPEALEKVAWAFATCGYEDEAVMSSIVTEVLNRLEDFSPQNLSTLAWAFSTLNLREEMFIDALRTVLSARSDAFKAGDLAKLVPAFVAWGCTEDAEGELFAACMDRLDRFSPRDLANVAEAYEKLGDKELLSTFLEGAAHRFATVSEHADARNWVDFTTIVARHADAATRQVFEPKFHAALLRPFVQRLRAVSDSGARGSLALQAEGEAAEATDISSHLRALQDFVAAIQLEDVGPYYSRQTLLAQYIPIFSTVVAGQQQDLLQVAADDQLVAATWELWWRRNVWVEPCARLFSAGVPRTGSKFLPPLSGHKAGAVRHALLHTAAVVMRKCPDEKLPEVQGCVRLLVSQLPGIDVFVALCQFRRYFRGVRLEVDYLDRTPAQKSPGG